VIQLEDLSRYFEVGDEVVHALDGIDLEIDDGEYVSVMGPSGSGKSTLLNILGLLDTPTGGEYRLGRADTAGMNDDQRASARQREIGFIFQFFHLVPRMTAAENVELPMTLAGIPPDERKRRVHEALDSVGLRDRAEHRPDQLSGGQRQRVAIARAIVMKPRVLLADEPTGNLDTASGNEVIDIMERLNRTGLTLIIVTHDPGIGKRSQRLVVLQDGKVASDTNQATQP
jgi:putative ABC transport system ATP-binding protein